ncbi:MAG: hypothetical protein KDA32_04475 [Phycisphaerales bacterium]|nr:hypothetical protein [Phycisphaerales bacterium]
MNETLLRDQEARLERDVRATLATLPSDEPLEPRFEARLRAAVRDEATRLRGHRRLAAWRGVLGAAAAAIGLALLPISMPKPLTPSGADAVAADAWLDNWAQAVDNSMSDLSVVLSDDSTTPDTTDPLEWMERWDSGIEESLDALESWYEA